MRRVQGPVLVLAVPGSGKTSVLVTRLGYMLFCGEIRPSQILTVTYTRAAAWDMRNRFSRIFGSEAGAKLDFRTINSFSVRVIRQYEREQNTKAFDIIPESNVTCLIRELYRKMTSRFAVESDVKAVRAGISLIKNMNMTDAEIDSQKLDDGTPIGALYREYCRRLRSLRQMDFDDQTVYAYRILRRYPHILGFFQSRYRYFCVDEAQDTSKIQHMMIRLLASADRNLFMVGDEDQSIYGFRAAYPQALLEFDRVYPGAPVLRMEQNYRSTGRIVAQADRFIQQNRSRLQKRMRTENEEGQPVRPIWVRDRAEQYRWIASAGSRCRGRETAVLYRDNDSAIPIIDLLNRQGTAYRCREMDDSFFTSRVVQDIRDMIRLAVDPADANLFLKIYYKMNAGITREQAQTAAKQSLSHGTPVLEELLRLSLPDWCRKKVVCLEKDLSLLLKDSAGSAVDRIVDSMGYGRYLQEKHAGQNKVTILQALAAQEKTPQEFLGRLAELRKIIQAGSTSQNAPLILSTIHASKGLEYDRVVLADVVDGLFPSGLPEEESGSSATGRDAEESENRLEEERRLFYVAMTRARKELVVIRFQDGSLSSSFAEFLFPKPKTEAGKSLQHRLKRLIHTAPWLNHPAGGEDVSAAAKEFYPGTRVRHKIFGPGAVTGRSGDLITVCFDRGGAVKKFALTMTLQGHLLTLEPM